MSISITAKRSKRLNEAAEHLVQVVMLVTALEESFGLDECRYLGEAFLEAVDEMAARECLD